MGYTFCSAWKSAEDIRSKILEENAENVVAHSHYGNEFYVAFKNYKNGQTGIVLFLISYQGGEYGYKAIGEESYPYYFNCPEKLLKLSNIDEELAVKWRKDCRETKVNKKIAKDLVLNAKLGDVINTDFGLVTFQFILKSSSGAFAAKNKYDKLFRYYPKNVVLS